jgi:hypothetical protein
MVGLVRIGTPEKVVLVGLGLVLLSLFLPWLTASEPVLLVDADLQSELTGAEATDGKVAAGGAVLAAICVLVDWRRRVSNGLAGIFAVTVVGIGSLYVLNPTAGAEASSPDVFELVDPGVGLYIAALGGVALFLGAVWSDREQRRRHRASESGHAQPAGSGATAGQRRQGTAGDGPRTAGPGPATGTGDRPRQPVADRPPRQPSEMESATSEPATTGAGWKRSAEWVYGVLGSLAMVLLMTGILVVDPAVSESEEALLGLLLIGTWIAVPVTTYFDLKHVRARRGWRPRWWLWTVLVAVPFLHTVTLPLYLLLRWRNVGNDRAGDGSAADPDRRQPGTGSAPRQPGTDPEHRQADRTARGRGRAEATARDRQQAGQRGQGQQQSRKGAGERRGNGPDGD